MSVFFQRDARHLFCRRPLGVRNRIHVHEVVVHRNGGSSWLILTPFLADVMIGAYSVHHTKCVPISQWHVSCLVSFSILCVGVSLGPDLTRPSSDVINFPSSSPFDILSSTSTTAFHSTLSSSQGLLFSAFTSVQCCQSYNLVERGLTTLRPRLLKIVLVSSRGIYVSMVHSPFVVYVHLDCSSISKVSKMCDFFLSIISNVSNKDNGPQWHEKLENIRNSKMLRVFEFLRSSWTGSSFRPNLRFVPHVLSHTFSVMFSARVWLVET